MSTAPGRRLGPVVTRLALAALLLVVGLAVRQTGRADERVAAALEQQATLPDVAASSFDEADRELGMVRQVPMLGAMLSREIAHRRAEALYWSGDYATLVSGTTDAEGEAATDPEMAALRASAMFRSLQRGRADQAVVRQLEAVLARYAQVLRQAPALVDAAYNYEAVVRVRDAAARGRNTALQPPEDENAQGDEGAPPPETVPGEFNVIVPLRPDERQDQFKAGSGSVPVRKG